MSLHQFCEWLASTNISGIIQNTSWVIPLTQTIHIVCIALLMGSVIMLDMRVFGIAGRGDSIGGTMGRLVPWIWGALPVLLLTGVVLTVGEPSRELENPAFQTKMILLIAAMVVTGVLQAVLQRDPAYPQTSPSRKGAVKLLALLSLILFVAIVFAGRFIAYTDHP